MVILLYYVRKLLLGLGGHMSCNGNHNASVFFSWPWFYIFLYPCNCWFIVENGFVCPGAVYAETLMIQGHHFSLLQHETEKLRNDIEKMRSELRYIHQFEQLALTNHHSCTHLIFHEFYDAIIWFVMQVWDGQSHCWAAIGFESWKGVSEE